MAYKICDLPESERPRERLKKYGQEALTAEELLAVLLGSGSKQDPVLKQARDLMTRFPSLKELREATPEELIEISGIGMAKALQIKAAFSLGMRTHYELNTSKIVIHSPQIAFKVALPYMDRDQREVFIILLLNRKGVLISTELISIGTLNCTLVHPREVFYHPMKRKANSIIAIHNHPSGNLKPSKDDDYVTNLLAETGDYLDIPLIDHLIISTHHYYSYREAGFKFKPLKTKHPYLERFL